MPIVLDNDGADCGVIPEVDGEGTNKGSERDVDVTCDDTKVTGCDATNEGNDVGKLLEVVEDGINTGETVLDEFGCCEYLVSP